MRFGKQWFFIVAIIVVGLTYLAFNGFDFVSFGGTGKISGAQDMRYGIDIRGGVEAYFQSADENVIPTTQQLEQARTIIETRLDSKNITDREVTIDKQRGVILVRFPWKSDELEYNPQTAIKELGETAKLTFVEGIDETTGEGGKIVIEGKHIVDASHQFNQDQTTGQMNYYVKLVLSEEGGKLFEEATGRLIDKKIAIKMDETIISNPTVKTKISGTEAVIDGMESIESAKALADKIKAGALPFALVSKSNSQISPTLGKNALNVMVKAGATAFILVCLFMLFYYRLPGFVSIFALTMQVVCQLLALSIPQYSLTLPGIAGIILSIGMGVDANIIIAERIKEELRSGKTLGGAIDVGFHRAFSAVRDGNITVMIVAVLLMMFGSGSMLSFGYTLLVGVILNFVTGVTASRIMIKSLSNFIPLRNTFLYGNRRAAQ